MLITFDIGNSNINIGVFDGNELKFVTRFATDKNRTAEQYAIEIATYFGIMKMDTSCINGSIISSVVPELTSILKDAVSVLFGVDSMVLGPGIKSGINIKIDNPAQLGADLVAGAVAALNKYPLPCLVLDLGTATKISVIDDKGAYRGCTIGAGVGVSMKALSGTASLLYSVDLENNNCPAYGTNTTASIQAGFILGTAAMLDGMCERIEESLGMKVQSIVATGGMSAKVIKHCRLDVTFEPNLILEGLRIIYNKNK